MHLHRRNKTNQKTQSNMGKCKEPRAISYSYQDKPGNNSGITILVILGLQGFTLAIK